MRWSVVASTALLIAACHDGTAPGDLQYRSLFPVTTGYSGMCGLRNGGTVECWGGLPVPPFDATVPSSAVPVRLPADSPRLIFLATDDYGYHCGLEADGRGWCGYGAPMAALDTPLRFERVAVIGGAGCGITAAGELHCWGDERRLPGVQPGTLPVCLPATSFEPEVRCAVTPVRIPMDRRVTSVSGGGERACLLLEDGEARCWGVNGLYHFAPEPTLGVLGTGNTVDEVVITPEPVQGGLRFVAVQAGRFGEGVCGEVMGDGVYCWGAPAFGRFEGGMTGGELLAAPTRLVPPEGRTLRGLAFESGGACALDQEDAAWCWSRSPDPVPALGNLRFESLAVSGFTACGIAASGAWCWGENGQGTVGNGTTSDQPVPVRVLGQGEADED